MGNQKELGKCPEEAARSLIGKELTYGGRTVIITETEAYGDEDPACYGVRYGRTKNTAALFVPGGNVFVYAGMLMITVDDDPEKPKNVLIRAGKEKGTGKLIYGPCRLVDFLGIKKPISNGKKLGEESGVFIAGEGCMPCTASKRGKLNAEKIAKDYERRYKKGEAYSKKLADEYVNKNWRFTAE